MKTILIALLFLSQAVFAQTFADFKDSQKIVLQGVEFGYSLHNEQSKWIDSIEYSYYTIDWYMSNLETFSKMFQLDIFRMPDDKKLNLTKKICLGKIYISNAISKETEDKFSAMIEEPNMEIQTGGGIFRKKNVMEVYNLKPTETKSTSINVILPKGQKPIVSLQAFVSKAY